MLKNWDIMLHLFSLFPYTVDPWSTLLEWLLLQLHKYLIKKYKYRNTGVVAVILIMLCISQYVFEDPIFKPTNIRISPNNRPETNTWSYEPECAYLNGSYPPVLSGASGMGGLVWVARVLRLVVHVSGRRWAGFTSPASSRRAALLADASQLVFALGDGLGGESQGQFE